MDRLGRVAKTFPDPELVLLEWLNLVVTHCMCSTPHPDLWRLMAMCAQSVAWEASACSPEPLNLA